MNALDIGIDEEKNSVTFKKKRTVPTIIEIISKFNSEIYS